MAEIGIRDLKRDASDVLRKVREDKASYDITYRGRVIARLVPAGPRARKQDARTVWRELDKLGQEISKHWPKGVSALDAVREQRR